jgi:glycosyltransferase involved in cell wall biosynthesis
MIPPIDTVHDLSKGSTSNMPTISVITVTLNCESLLPRLVRSLLSQDDQDFEWVIVDGKSTDRTLEIATQFPRARTRIVSEPDFGIYDALNKGVRAARGDYYLVIGADDELYEHAISSFRRAAAENDWDIITAFVDTDSATLRPMRGGRWLRAGNAFVSSHAVGSLIRRELHTRCGYYSNRYVNCADMHFILSAVSKANARIGAVTFTAGRYCNSGVSTVDRICSQSDVFRIQLTFGESRALQFGLYILRLLRTLFLRR